MQIKVATVCGVDVMLYDWTYSGRNVPVPIVLGHEGSGEVIEVGSTVSNIKVGDRVGLESMFGCGNCYFCHLGNSNLCKQLSHTFAEFIVIPASSVNILPLSVSYEEGAFLEPISIVCHTLKRLNISVGDTAVVIGPGPMGLLHLQALKSAGCGLVIMTGYHDDQNRLKVAKELGADQIVYVDKTDPTQLVLDCTEGLGADIVIEAGGTSAAVEQAMGVVRPGGQIAVIGLSPQQNLSGALIARKNVNLFGVVGSNHRHYREAIRWLEKKKISGSSIITHKFTINDGIAGIEAMKSKSAAKAIYEF